MLPSRRRPAAQRAAVALAVLHIATFAEPARLRGGAPAALHMQGVAQAPGVGDNVCRPCLTDGKTDKCLLVEMLDKAVVSAKFPTDGACDKRKACTTGIGTSFGGTASSAEKRGRFFVVNTTAVPPEYEQNPQGTDRVSTIAEITYDDTTPDKGKATTFIAAGDGPGQEPRLVMPSDIAFGAGSNGNKTINTMYIANQGADYRYGNILRVDMDTGKVDGGWKEDVEQGQKWLLEKDGVQARTEIGATAAARLGRRSAGCCRTP